jgi:molybdopterin converting factor small subunit
MIDVRLYAHLAPGAGGSPVAVRGAAATGGAPQGAAAGAPPAPRSAEFQVEARPGLTVRDVVVEAGVRPEDVYIIMLNSVRVDLDAPLTDGDRLGLFPAVSGG